jgi:hypothetical protein
MRPGSHQPKRNSHLCGSSLFSMECQLAVGLRLLLSPIPKGLNPLAQGCEERATLGGEFREIPTLKGLNLFPKNLICNPFRVDPWK